MYSMHQSLFCDRKEFSMPFNYEQNLTEFAEMESGYNPETGSWEVIVKYSGDVLRVEAELGVQVEILGEGYAIITLQQEQIPQLYDFKEIEYIEMPRRLALNLNQSLRSSCVTEVQRPEGLNLTGRGMLVGIIDSGIDYTHPDFRNPDGTSRILCLWDQTADGIPPQGFRQGAEYNSDLLNQALASDQPYDIVPSGDEIGHGTAVAGIAAGNGSASGGRERGVAPEASLIIVKLGIRGRQSFARTTEIMRAFKYILDQAEELGIPVAINLSYGTNDGSHDGNSLFERYIDDVSQRWKNAIVVASGNEGSAGHHFSAVINTGEVMEVTFGVGESLSSLYMVLWKEFTDRFTVELILPSGISTGEIFPTESYTARNIDGVAVKVYYGQPTHYNEDQEVHFQIDERTAMIPQGIWRLRIRALDVVEGRFDIWLPTAEEVGRNTAFTQPSVETTITIPATAFNVISVGGYNAPIQAAAEFSGRGYTRAYVYVKPDLVAPAVGILSARAGGGYDTFTGTSMAAPFVTGAAALIMQWGIVMGNDPFLYGQRVKAFLQKGAVRSSRMSYPNPVWGYGSLCLSNSMSLLVGYMNGIQ